MTQSSEADVKAAEFPAKAGQDPTPFRGAGPASASLPAFRSRALAIVREGRVSVCRVNDNEQHEPQRVMAFVTSSRSPQIRYLVERGKTPPSFEFAWSCTCRSGMRDEPCAHVYAVALVTCGVAA